MEIERWPNKLGYDINDGRFEHEIWILFDGAWGVRTFADHGADRWLRIDPRDYLVAPTMIEAVNLCKRDGAFVDLVAAKAGA